MVGDVVLAAGLPLLAVLEGAVSHKHLVDALAAREREYRAALDRLNEALEPEQWEATQSAYHLLREAIEIVRCARRMVPACTLEQVHKAFGAPGDFGYETPIGAALARVYGLTSEEL
jgi:hypothetical protein